MLFELNSNFQFQEIEIMVLIKLKLKIIRPVGFNFEIRNDENDYIEAQIAKYYQTNNALKNTTVSTTDGTGVQHGETISLTAPNNMSLTFHAGKIDQKGRMLWLV